MPIMTYINIALLIALGGNWWYMDSNIDSLTKDNSDQAKLIIKLENKNSELLKATKMLKSTEEANTAVVVTLSKEIDKLNSIAKSGEQNHKAEIQKYKMLIKGLQEDVTVLGDVLVENCIVQIEEVQDENDIIGNSINNIGF